MKKTIGSKSNLVSMVHSLCARMDAREFSAPVRSDGLPTKNFTDRGRNNDGQFMSGVAANPDDMAMAYKKKVGKIAGVGVLGAGAIAAAVPGSRKALVGAGRTVMSKAGQVLLRR